VGETERAAIVQSRLGQGRFRQDLLDYWHGCAVTGCQEPLLLRASHIKPWRNSTNQERLDPFNGLMLVPTLDTAFDAGLISFADDGHIILSDQLDVETQLLVGINDTTQLLKIEAGHRRYLEYHRQHVLR
jgi:5-methylcytosine-specific restriction protein A